jgi:hemoglobin
VSEIVTPYERLGGSATVDEIVASFYERIVADPDLSPFFAHTDMAHMMSMQREYVATAMGGPGNWSPDRLREAHAGRGIQGPQFARFLEIFLETLRDRGLDDDDIESILNRMAIASTDVLSSPTETG